MTFIRIGMERQFHNGFSDHTQPEQQLGDFHIWKLAKSHCLPVDRFWVSSASQTNAEPHFILPHGEPSLALMRKRDRFGFVVDIKIVICGPTKRARWHQPSPNSELIAFRLRPEFAAAAFQLDLGEIYDTDVATLGAPIVGDADRTRRAAETGGTADIAKALFHDLLAANRCGAFKQTIEAEAAYRIRESKGIVSISTLAAQLGADERTLRRRFKNTMGVSPKTYACQHRLSHAAVLADQSALPDWASIAVNSGYYDQAHMIADFNAMTGVTPRRAHKRRRKLSVFSNTATPAGP